MAEYRISGVWKPGNEITHYAVHEGTLNTLKRSTRMSKADTIQLVRNSGNSVKTILWDYTNAKWKLGQKVHATTGINGYLHTDPNSTVTDNLQHLIDYDWLLRW
ncbi:hypothetical protein HYN59_02825 [Flavobacterium album]|uniref:DUF3892 domain-containing protein n=1 Tax=Flavobacterium album TaxID=2175091 RepID=A0A2S1QUL9_9FLAO|nr:DUF3892 domain-containing protein [Flavobacterium album]AWH84107.1 hypothetical protein HYN59_02825 [Flavobacterium album]